MVFALPDRGVAAWPVVDHSTMDDIVPREGESEPIQIVIRPSVSLLPSE